MRRAFALLVTAALALTACGNPGDSSRSATTSPSPSTTQTGETTTAPTTAGNPAVVDDRQTITVGGVGRVYAEPVRAVVDLGVTVRRSTVYEATRVAARSAEAMREVLLGQGIDPKDIQTTDYYVGTYSLDWPTITGYETTIGYRVSIPDVGSVGVVLAAATEAGGDDVRASGIRFEADASALTDDARAMAWADVTHRAEDTAKLAGASLGAVLDVHEKVLVSTSTGMYQGGEGDAASFDIPVSPGVSGVVVLLTVTYEIH